MPKSRIFGVSWTWCYTTIQWLITCNIKIGDGAKILASNSFIWSWELRKNGAKQCLAALTVMAKKCETATIVKLTLWVMTVVMKGFNSLLMVNLRPSMGQKSNYARCLTHHHLAVKFRANEANGAQCANVSTTTSNFVREICFGNFT